MPRECGLSGRMMRHLSASGEISINGRCFRGVVLLCVGTNIWHDHQSVSTILTRIQINKNMMIFFFVSGIGFY